MSEAKEVGLRMLAQVEAVFNVICWYTCKACSHFTSNQDWRLIIMHLLHSNCTRVGVKPDWIRIHLNPLREVVSIRIEVNPV